MQIVYAPDARAEALARSLAGLKSDACVPAGQTPPEENVLLLVTTDYYSHAFWQLKRRLTQWGGKAEGKVCACLVCADSEIGAELAVRSLAWQLLAAGGAVCLCAEASPDGTVHAYACRESCRSPENTPEFYTKLRQMAEKFG